jgi:NHL repeat
VGSDVGRLAAVLSSGGGRRGFVPRAIRATGGALALILAMLVVASVGAPTADAATTYKNTGSFGAYATGTPTRLAVDDSSGDVLLVKSDTGTVLVFDSGGASATQIGEFGAGELSSPYGIAIDQTNGDVYVTDSGDNRIVRYISNGATPPVYAADPSYVSPSLSPTPGVGAPAGTIGSFASPIAIDPTNGDLLIADTANKRVSRFTAAGSFVSSFDGSGSPGGAFHSLLDIAVGSAGESYVVDALSEPLELAGGESVVERFGADGTPEGALQPVPTPRAVAFDAKSGNVIVGGNSQLDNFSNTHPRLYVFNANRLVTDLGLPEETAGSFVAGLASDGGGGGTLYALLGQTFGFLGTQNVQVFAPLHVPDLTINPAGSVGSSSAVLSGTVSPDGEQSTAYFEYTSDGVNWTLTPPKDEGSGETIEPIQAELIELAPFTSYEARLVGVSEQGSITTGVIHFDTEKSAPGLRSVHTSNLTPNSATLGAAVNPFGLPTTFRFEYGPTPAYGQRVPANTDGIVSSSRSFQPVSAGISGLTPGGVYHFRVVATNAIGQSMSPDATFTEPFIEPPSRVFEQVSPVEKGGAILNTLASYQARSDGEALVYQAKNAMDLQGTESATVENRYLGTRSPLGWDLHQLNVPQLPRQTGGSTVLADVLAVSEDQTKALVVSNRVLAPGGVEEGSNLYLRDLGTGKYTLIAAGPAAFYNQATFAGAEVFYGGSSDFGTVVIGSETPLTASATPGVYSIYVWSDGDLRLASTLPDGSSNQSFVHLGNINPPERRFVSADGRRIAVSINTGPEAGIYLWKDGNSEAVSVSHRSGEAQTPQPGQIFSMSRDGAYLTFGVIGPIGLTPDAPDEENDIYRYDVAARTLTYIGNGSIFLGMSEDGSTIYFEHVSPHAIEVWRNGKVRVLTDAEVQYISSLKTSPDGRFFVFSTTEQVTDYDNRNEAACPARGEGNSAGRCNEVYVYDADADTVECASCPGDGSPSIGNALSGGVAKIELSGYVPRLVNDAGQVFFDTASPLVPGDTNGTRDVYEFDHGDVRLISGGRPGAVSRFADASADGRDVFFTTTAQLVGQDRDNEIDMYDARIGGGIRAQEGPLNDSCEGLGCRAAAGMAPLSPVTGSESFGDGRRARRLVRKCARKHAKRQRKKCVTRRRHSHGKSRGGRGAGK